MADEDNLKYNNFIEKLYTSPSSTPEDKARIVKLLLSEREKGFVTREDVEKMIAENSGKIIERKGDEFTHNPRKMVKFLYQFSINDNYKWFTHAPDPNMDFDYFKYVSDAEEQYNIISKSINTATWGNVKNFIFNTKIAPKDSLDKKIEYSWRDLSDWCLNNRNIHPYETLLGDYKFSHYIDIFKNTIEFRTDNPDYLFSNRLEDFFFDEVFTQGDINLIFSDDFYSVGGHVRAYLDIRQFFIAIREMSKWIISNKAKGHEVEIGLNESSDRYIFSIFHKGSYLNLDKEKMKGRSGDIEKVRNVLLNVADWTILSDTSTMGPLSIKCLCEQTKNVGSKVNSDNIIDELPDKVGGVKHLITFYKNIQ